MSAAPFFSVIIPVHDRACVLAAALHSVLAQTWQDFEVIVVDDGSDDEPEKIIKEIGDPRIRLVRQPNLGASTARNTGIDMARGAYVAFLDSDDVFLPHHLETMQRVLNGRRKIAAFGRVIVDRGKGRTFLKPPRGPRQGEHMASYLLCDRGFVPTITLVVDSEIARRIKYDSKLRYGEDKDFALRLYLAGCQFVMVERPGAIWLDRFDRARASSDITTSGLNEWLERLPSNIPVRAIDGYRGWVIAKGIALKHPIGALRLYLHAVFTGCYRPHLAAVIFLQIFLPGRAYRWLADLFVVTRSMAKPAQQA